MSKIDLLNAQLLYLNNRRRNMPATKPAFESEADYRLIMNKLIDDGYVRKEKTVNKNVTTIMHRVTFEGDAFIEAGGYDEGTGKKKINEVSEIGAIKGTQKQIALFYHYLIMAELREQMGFAPGEEGKMNALEVIAIKHGLSPKGFQLAFNKYSNKKSGAWITGTKQNIKDIKEVCAMLADYRTAQSLAENDLKQAEIAGEKRGNPIM